MKGIWNLVKGLGTFLGGVGSSSRFGKMVKGIGISSKNPFSGGSAHIALGAFKMQAVISGLTLLGPGTPDEKLTNVALNLGVAFMTLGMNSAWKQFGWGVAASLMPHFGSITRGIVSGYRSTLEARTSVAIPFSHSTVSMDIAAASLQYARHRMSDAYTNLGSEAAFFHARFMSRG